MQNFTNEEIDSVHEISKGKGYTGVILFGIGEDPTESTISYRECGLSQLVSAKHLLDACIISLLSKKY